MEILACFAFLAIVACVIGGIFGLGWFVIGPLGEINRIDVNTTRFQLLDLLWLVFLLQPSLALFGILVRESRDAFGFQWIAIFVLIWIGTIVAWYAMIGALAKAGITHVGRRAAGVLLILPMISIANPLAIAFQFVMVAGLAEGLHPDTRFGTVLVCIAVEVTFVAALFGCRGLSRWIAGGIPEARSDVS